MQLSRSSFTRRNLLRLSGASTVAAVGMSACAPRQVPVTSTAPVELAGAETAWRQLLDGNARFVEGRATYPHQTADGRQSLVAERHPFACVIACADSRVGPEAVSGGALGDLFVIRSAGEVLDDAVVGSVEYGVEHLRVPLVAVEESPRPGTSRFSKDGAPSIGQSGGQAAPQFLGVAGQFWFHLRRRIGLVVLGDVTALGFTCVGVSG
ncbi:carbonic anhydrase [Saccharopolyspora sp. NPDC050389]|uniref:carbonic anhydrase n=1 Tax=Saccharopolyspora sp. NPDC050389 TaxID=3155516 RepID=UPI0033E26D2F